MDCLPAELASYSLDSDPSYTVATYMDGTQAVERTYVIASREAIGSDITQNAANLEWYDALAAWIRRQRRVRNWPDIGQGAHCLQYLCRVYAVPFCGRSKWRGTVSNPNQTELLRGVTL